MCGICGKVSKCNINKQLIYKMNDKIFHRGPNEDGYFFEKNIGLAMRRLSIIDLVDGKQPIYNEEKNLIIVFNGEIYNYKQLIKELVQKGHNFSTHSDTEVIIHSYEEWGYNCVSKLNGMFSFAIYNRSNKELFIARDRLGVKPLYYSFSKENKEFIFGSELKCILEDESISKEIDENAVSDYFSLYYIPAPETIFKSIKKLPPSHYLIYNNNEIYIKRYWNLSEKREKFDLNKESCTKAVRELVVDAVKKRMYTDVPMGTFLSGGIDSSIVTAILARESNDKINTFSIGYKDEKLLDESEYVKMMVEKYNTNHHHFYIDENDLLGCLPDIINNLDEPFADSSMIPSYIVSKYAKEYVSVCLSGDGGDEMFGGYTKYTMEHYRYIYNLIPRILKEPIEKVILNKKSGFNSRYENFIRKGQKFLASNEDAIYKRYLGLSQVFNINDKKALFKSNEFVNGISTKIVEDIFDESVDFDIVYRYMYADLHFALPEDMLVKVDRMSMLASLEVRSPFLDYRIAEMSINIPTNYKLSNKNGKIILKNAFNDYLPSEIINGTKKGFVAPLGKWINGKLRDEILDTLGESNVNKIGIFKYEYIDQLIKEHMTNKKDNSWKLWTLYIFMKWYFNIIGN